VDLSQAKGGLSHCEVLLAAMSGEPAKRPDSGGVWEISECA
jgi:hypothetical protein